MVIFMVCLAAFCIAHAGLTIYEVTHLCSVRAQHDVSMTTAWAADQDLRTPWWWFHSSLLTTACAQTPLLGRPTHTCVCQLTPPCCTCLPMFRVCLCQLSLSVLVTCLLWLSSPGLGGITKPIFSIPLFSQFFRTIKRMATYWISCSYLTDVT